MIADIQELRVEPGQNRLARTSGIRPEADISLECLKMSANDPKRTLNNYARISTRFSPQMLAPLGPGAGQ